jgi:hypothetical protein
MTLHRRTPMNRSRTLDALVTFSLIGLLGMTIWFDVPESAIAVVAGLTGSALTFFYTDRKDDTDE